VRSTAVANHSYIYCVDRDFGPFFLKLTIDKCVHCRRNCRALMEITMRNLMATGKIDLSDFLARADVRAATGKTELISDYEPIALRMIAASLPRAIHRAVLRRTRRRFSRHPSNCSPRIRGSLFLSTSRRGGQLTTVQNIVESEGSGNSTISMKACRTTSRVMFGNESRMRMSGSDDQHRTSGSRRLRLGTAWTVVTQKRPSADSKARRSRTSAPQILRQ
jgi:hypothetical protein